MRRHEPSCLIGIASYVPAIHRYKAFVAPVHPVSLPAKMEFFLCSNTRQQNDLPLAAVSVGVNHVLPSIAVHDLRILRDNDISVWSHVSRTVSGCFAILVIQSLTLCFIRWSCRWSCHVFTAINHLPGFLHPSFVDFSWCSTLLPD